MTGNEMALKFLTDKKIRYQPYLKFRIPKTRVESILSVGLLNCPVFIRVVSLSNGDVDVNFYVAKTGKKIIPFISTRYYLDLENWNILTEGIRDGYSVIVDNLQYIFKRNGVDVSDRELKSMIEDIYIQGVGFEVFAEEIFRRSNNSSRISRLILGDNRTTFNIDHFFFDYLSFFENTVQDIRLALRGSSKKLLNALIPDLDCHIREGGDFGLYIRPDQGLYTLLRTKGKDYAMLYLKIAPSLYNKFPIHLGLVS